MWRENSELPGSKGCAFGDWTALEAAAVAVHCGRCTKMPGLFLPERSKLQSTYKGVFL